MNSLNSLLRFSFVLRSQAEYACPRYMSVLSSYNSLALANSNPILNAIIKKDIIKSNKELFFIIAFNIGLEFARASEL
ncbi:MAG TPA: hypothetical protein GXX70_08490 [Tepidimicrobium sp.]|nr:hypothetical protein [Tepidimicrobium sp.]